MASASSESAPAGPFVEVVIVNGKHPGPFELLYPPFNTTDNAGQPLLNEDGGEQYIKRTPENFLYLNLDKILKGESFFSVSRSDPRLVEFVRENGKNIPGLEIQRVEAGLDFCIQKYRGDSEEIMTAYDKWFSENCPPHEPGEILIVDSSCLDDY